MRKSEAKRIICAVAAELIRGNLFFEAEMSEDDEIRIHDAIEELYEELRRRSGLEIIPGATDDIAAAILLTGGAK